MKTRESDGSKACVIAALSAALGASSCTMPGTAPSLAIPAVEYSNRIRSTHGDTMKQPLGSVFTPASIQPGNRSVVNQQPYTSEAKPQLRFANDTEWQPAQSSSEQIPLPAPMQAEPMAAFSPSEFETNLIPQRVAQAIPGDYNGALSLGDPGVSASLWRDSSGTPDFFRDTRAWQPMDLITVLISENAKGTKEADTEVKSDSTIELALENLLGYEDSITDSNKDIDLGNVVKAASKNEFKGEGETTRKGTLKGTLSAMVVEVLPSGILRIEGTKIISVNNEEQIMLLSGLVRSRDISAENQIESARVANMRIDYYGSGQVGSAQREGWLGHILRKVWPF